MSRDKNENSRSPSTPAAPRPAGGRRRFWIIAISIVILAGFAGTEPLVRILREQRALEALKSPDELRRHEASLELVELQSTRAVEFWMEQLLAEGQGGPNNVPLVALSSTSIIIDGFETESANTGPPDRPDPWTATRILSIQPAGRRAFREAIRDAEPAQLARLAQHLESAASLAREFVPDLARRVPEILNTDRRGTLLSSLISLAPKSPEVREVMLGLIDPEREELDEKTELALHQMAGWLQHGPDGVFEIFAKWLDSGSPAWKEAFLDTLTWVEGPLPGADFLLPGLLGPLESGEVDLENPAIHALGLLTTDALEQNLEALLDRLSNLHPRRASRGFSTLLERESLHDPVLEYIVKLERPSILSALLNPISETQSGLEIPTSEALILFCQTHLEHTDFRVRAQAIRRLFALEVLDFRTLAALERHIRESPGFPGQSLNLLAVKFGDRPAVRERILEIARGTGFSLSLRTQLCAHLRKIPEEVADEITELLRDPSESSLGKGVQCYFLIPGDLRGQVRLEASLLPRLVDSKIEKQRDLAEMLLGRLDPTSVDREILLLCLGSTDVRLVTRALFKIFEKGERNEDLARAFQVLSENTALSPRFDGLVGRFWVSLGEDQDVHAPIIEKLRENVPRYRRFRELELPPPTDPDERKRLTRNTIAFVSQAFETRPDLDSRDLPVFEQILRGLQTEAEERIFQTALEAAYPQWPLLALTLVKDPSRREKLESRLEALPLSLELDETVWLELVRFRVKRASPDRELPADLRQSILDRLSPETVRLHEGVIEILKAEKRDLDFLRPALRALLEFSKSSQGRWFAACHLASDPGSRGRIEILLAYEIEKALLDEGELRNPRARFGQSIPDLPPDLITWLARITSRPHQTGNLIWKYIHKPGIDFIRGELGPGLAALAELGTHREEVVGKIREILRRPPSIHDWEVVRAVRSFDPPAVELLPDLKKAREQVRSSRYEKDLGSELEALVQELSGQLGS